MLIVISDLQVSIRRDCHSFYFYVQLNKFDKFRTVFEGVGGVRC